MTVAETQSTQVFSKTSATLMTFVTGKGEEEEERRGGKAKGGERENVLEILPLVLYFVLDFEGATISAMYSKR